MMTTTIDPAIAVALTAHVRFALEQPGRPAPGQGRDWDQGSVRTHLGRRQDGRWYVDARIDVEESYDDDFGSRTCVSWCRQKGSAHVHYHRLADSLDGLLDAETHQHAVPVR